mmetsp:Transcript_15389/g.39654  ORF Transcript_15389/g.39654 Transcript_15389/m.39654 type:complete len:393 (+) Transcript_15389:224-1402(+)
MRRRRQRCRPGSLGAPYPRHQVGEEVLVGRRRRACFLLNKREGVLARAGRRCGCGRLQRHAQAGGRLRASERGVERVASGGRHLAAHLAGRSQRRTPKAITSRWPRCSVARIRAVPIPRRHGSRAAARRCAAVRALAVERRSGESRVRKEVAWELLPAAVYRRRDGRRLQGRPGVRRGLGVERGPASSARSRRGRGRRGGWRTNRRRVAKNSPALLGRRGSGRGGGGRVEIILTHVEGGVAGGVQLAVVGGRRGGKVGVVVSKAGPVIPRVGSNRLGTCWRGRVIVDADEGQLRHPACCRLRLLFRQAGNVLPAVRGMQVRGTSGILCYLRVLGVVALLLEHRRNPLFQACIAPVRWLRMTRRVPSCQIRRLRKQIAAVLHVGDFLRREGGH